MATRMTQPQPTPPGDAAAAGSNAPLEFMLFCYKIVPCDKRYR
jgi:hypothetical protein